MPKIQLRRGTVLEFENYKLDDGEIGFVTDSSPPGLFVGFDDVNYPVGTVDIKQSIIMAMIFGG